MLFDNGHDPTAAPSKFILKRLQIIFDHSQFSHDFKNWEKIRHINHKMAYGYNELGVEK